MLIETLKADRILALKARDEVKKNLLGTLTSAATKDTKTPEDAAVVATIRAFMKSLDETIGLLDARGLDAGQQRAERAILEAYLPPVLDAATLQASIAGLVAELPERTPKAMGQVMASLKAKHGAALDAKAASRLVREALA